jgi:hemerythrin-like domain-containing protein
MHPMDAVKLLKDDHEKVKGLFRQFEKARSADKKKQLADEIMLELEVHSKIEEEIFYPAVKEQVKGQDELVAEAVEEHHVVDVLMQEIKALDPSDERFEAKMTVLIENVEHHIEEEESEMLPDAKKKLGKDTAELGAQMEQRKQALMATAAR